MNSSRVGSVVIWFFQIFSGFYDIFKVFTGSDFSILARESTLLSKLFCIPDTIISELPLFTSDTKPKLEEFSFGWFS